MLSTPYCGWTEITIGKWHDRASYLTDVPYDILKAIINTLKTGHASCVECDAEGWDYIIVFNTFDTHIITSRDGYELSSIDINIKNLAKEVYNDIHSNLNNWSDWYWDARCDYYSSKANLAILLRKLKKLIQE